MSKDTHHVNNQAVQEAQGNPVPYREQRVRYPGAAKVTQLRVSTLKKYVSLRLIPFEKIGTPGSHGGAVLFKVGALLDWMAGHAVEPGERN
ncbi:MAG TPA: hypothetical protein PK200_03155 [Spirochaetota bacterium]|nr:hypothetical protein [Spirochaetota bacterium]